MDLFSKLEQTNGVTIFCGVTVTIGKPVDGKFSFSVVPASLKRKVRKSDYALLAMHYYSHILSGYPREDLQLDKFGMKLRQMVADIIEQGIWPGSDLLRYAGVQDKVLLLGSEESEGKKIHAFLFRTLLADDLDLALEIPPSIDNDVLNLSVIALFQKATEMFDEPEIELLDKSLRYIRTYIYEGANYASPAAAQNLANRAFREAGGEVV